MTATEPENVIIEQVLGGGVGVCSGYVPGAASGVYMEIWKYRGYVYAVVVRDAGNELHKLGVCWEK